MKQVNLKKRGQKGMRLRILFFLVAISAIGLTTQAQVSIGATEEAVEGSLLQIKEKENVVDDALNAYRGVALPRVTLSEKKQLYPMFLADPNDPASGPNADYAANKATLDKTHTGLIVYNLVEDDDKELCLGLNQWNGEQWDCFQQKASPAQFEIQCGTLEVRGDYGDGIALNSSNYLRVEVEITRIGSYSISASFAPASPLGDNGYFFELSGTFYATGTFFLTIPGTGQPKVHTQGADLLELSDDTPDQFVLTSTGGGLDCGFEVNVRSTAARPEFNIDCGATVVQGAYFEDVPLSSTPGVTGESNRIKVTLRDIPPTAFGAVAILETNSVDGFSFKGQAVLTSNPQDVYLEGTGVPRGLNDKIFTITTNSETTDRSCAATVYMLIPRKRLMTLGNTSGFGYNAGLVDPPNSLNTLLTDKNNFGYNQWSILKFAGFSNLGTAAQANFIPTSPNGWADDNRDIVALETTTWRNMSATKLGTLLFGTTDGTPNGPRGTTPKMDIFMIGYDTEYFRNSNTDDAARCAKLVDFVKSGGILMVCSEENMSNENFLNLFFNNPSPAISSSTGAGAGSNYTLGFNNINMNSSAAMNMKPYYCKDDDPILKGPFEDIVGRNWGEDASTTKYLTNLPLDEIVIYSGAREIGNTLREATGVTIFRHREYPLIFIGDGGFNSNYSARTSWNTSSSICPFILTNKIINGETYNNYPTYRFNFGGSGNRVYNALFTANAFAWCIMKAEEIRRASK
jgi:hypothetical protein